MKKIVVGMVAAALVVGLVRGQTDGEWELQDAEDLFDVVGDSREVEGAILSPDGEQVALFGPETICIAALADASTVCTPFPEGSGLGVWRNQRPVWSPDGSQIALTENFFMFYKDSDIWMFDVEDATFTNLTDDDYSGGFISNRAPAGLPADVLPTWNPVTGDLYFFRMVQQPPGSEPAWTLGLYRMSAEGEPELLYDLSRRLPVLSIYRPVAFSPDGERVALLVIPANLHDNPATGVWLLDLEDGRLEHITTLREFQTGIPEWAERALVPDAVHWGQEGLIVYAQDFDSGRPSQLANLFYVEPRTGNPTPVLDLGAFDSAEALTEARADDPTAASMIPLPGILSSDGGFYWWVALTTMPPRAALYEIPVSPVGEEPRLLGELPPGVLMNQEIFSTLGANGRLLIDQWLMELERNDAAESD